MAVYLDSWCQRPNHLFCRLSCSMSKRDNWRQRYAILDSKLKAIWMLLLRLSVTNAFMFRTLFHLLQGNLLLEENVRLLAKVCNLPRPTSHSPSPLVVRIAYIVNWGYTVLCNLCNAWCEWMCSLLESSLSKSNPLPLEGCLAWYIEGQSS